MHSQSAHQIEVDSFSLGNTHPGKNALCTHHAVDWVISGVSMDTVMMKMEKSCPHKEPNQKYDTEYKCNNARTNTEIFSVALDGVMYNS
jgi:hypothetical protein